MALPYRHLRCRIAENRGHLPCRAPAAPRGESTASATEIQTPILVVRAKVRTHFAKTVTLPFPHFNHSMARPPIIRTNVCRLRLALSMNQTSFAKLLARSMAAVQSLEMGRLRLSQQLAGEIASRTGVNPRWLLDNQLTEEPYDMSGKPWSLDQFHKLKAEIPHHLKQDDAVFRQRMLELGMQLGLARNVAGLRRLYRAMDNGGSALELGRKVDQFFARLMSELDVKPDVNMAEEIRFAELEADRKSQNVLRVMGVAQPQQPIRSPIAQPQAVGEPRPRGRALVGAAWRK